MSHAPRAVLFATLLATCSIAPAIIRRHDRDDAAYLERGAKYPAVVRLRGATATLIEPQWLLTAGHVIANLSPFDRFVEIKGRQYRIEGAVWHPKWRSKAGPRSVDIGLVKLAEPVAGVEPARLYERQDEVGQEVVFVGPGEYGDGLDGPQGDDGRWRAATNVVTAALENYLTFKFDAPPDGTELEGISGPGDSGGPALVEADGRLLIMGVSSANDDAGAAGPCRYNSTEYYTRVSAVADWIRDTIRTDGPTTRPAAEIVDARDENWPATDAGRVAEAFFAAYAKGDDEGMAAFERTCRSPAALRQRPVEERVASWRKLHAAWGKLKPSHWAATPDGKLHVLVHAAKEDVWKTLSFELETEPPHKLIGINIASPTLVDR